MKVVIIGGGIAGLTLGVYLNNKNTEVVVCERLSGIPSHGHAFLMHTDGSLTLDELDLSSNTNLIRKKINSFGLYRPDGKEIKRLKLNYWHCIKRSNLIKYLYELLPANIIKENREFSHFIYKNDKIIAAAFVNGEVEYGDIFVGADGGNSKVREIIFGKVDFTPVKVKEVVGVSYNKEVGKTHSDNFTKIQKKTSGLAFGYIPTAKDEFVWFMQFDPSISDISNTTPAELRSFCFNLLNKFPKEVVKIIETNDFSSSYIWNTRDFGLLPKFHKDNVVLIGDAAHLAVPFTSAGTTNAIVDAKTLMECLEHNDTYEEAFEKYYSLRSEDVYKHIQLGRELSDLFLNPKEINDDNIPVPLISHKEDTRLIAKSKEIQVLYFTDPICSTCWIIQPLLRKLILEYGKYVNIEYCMGGLLPSWDEYNSKGKIGNPNDAAKHWEEVCAFHEMPLDGDIWKEDPLTSSYPPSTAFKAAQMQDNDLAILFLRRIKEMVFLEKKNIIKWEHLEKAAFEVGLDSARLLRDFNGKARERFIDDLTLAKQLGVTAFPTLFFSNNKNHSLTLKGYNKYEKFEKIILQLLPNIKKTEINNDPVFLFTHFPTMTDKEFSLLSNTSLEKSKNQLTELFKKGQISKYESKNGVIWISKFEHY